MLQFLCLLIGIVLLIVAAFGVNVPRVGLFPLGVAFVSIALGWAILAQVS